ncbi:MAG: hypothetical protein DME23_14180 [Verrucomicrobia bacterium]|nr:MAG: hypothetical protein DME23_14180 [Verrucomicrobiota bacterium]
MFSNVGRMWSINWIAYAELTWRPITINGNTTFIPDFPVVVHVPGGGTEVNHSTAPNDRSFARVTISTDGVLCTRTLPDGTRQLFNTGTFLGPAFLDQLIDPSGNTLSFTYDLNLRLVAVTDAIGQVTTLDYTWPGDIRKVTKITDPFGRFATFSYSGNSNELSSVTDELGLTTTFSYDTNEFLTSMTTPYGSTTFANTRAVTPQVSYDYALTAIDPQGDREMVRYIEPIAVPSLGPPLPSFINVGGTNVPFIAEDARLNFRNSFYWNKRAMQQGPGDFSVARNYRWLTDGNYLITPILEAIKEPLENRVWFNYPNQLGRSDYSSFFPYYAGEGGLPEKKLRMLSDGTPQLTQTYYNALGQVTNAVDPRGRTTIYNYESNLIDLLEIRQKTGPGASERVAAFTYSSKHLPLTAVDAAGQTNRFTYNTRGQAVTFTNPKGEITTLSYDTNGYLLTIDGALPGTNDMTSLTYDGFGRVRTITGPDAYYITLDYDAMDRLTAITFPDGSTEQFTYNRLDLVSTRDRMGRQTHYTYNSLRQLVQVQDALNRITRFDWCECGGLSSVTDPLGRMTSWQYDVQGRVTSKQYADGSKISYNYDRATGQLKSIVDEKGQIRSYDYYVDDNLKSIAYPNAQVPTPTVTFSYDSNYNRATAMQDGVGTTTWSYYPPGVLGALKVSTVIGPWTNAMVNYQYDPLRRMINRTINGEAQGYAFDALGRLTNVVNSPGSFSYDYDRATFRLREVTFSNGQRSHYDYFDNLGDRRLRGITHTKPDASLISRFTYDYDPVGNITNWVQETGAQSQTWSIGYDAADQLLNLVVKQAGTNLIAYNYGYDSSGNRLFEETNGVRRTFIYNPLNQLVSSSDVAGNGVAYEWDPEERLVAVTQGGRRSEFTYDGLGRRVAIVEKTNGVVLANNSFVWCGSEICEKRDSNGATVQSRFYAQGEEVTAGAGTTDFFYTKDHLGSIREVLDANGALVSRFYYDPWGAASTLLGPNTTFAFTGHFLHAPSGLYLAYYRCLSSATGRWLSRDRIGEVAGLNLYAYLGNNPLNDTDELGLQADINLVQGEAYRNAQKIPSVPDEIIVVIHGNPVGPVVNRNHFSPKDLAKLIRKLRKFKSAKRVRLISCDTGLGRYPQELANWVSKEVLAPTSAVTVNPDGTYNLQQTEEGEGKWEPFQPNGPPLSPKPQVEIKL